jgi:hypothetical protein
VLGRIALELQGVLSGKTGALSQWYQRNCVLQALRSTAAAALALLSTGNSTTDSTTAAVPAAVASVAALLVPAAEKEAHEETKALAMLALSDWAAAAVPANSSSTDAR